MKTWKTKRTVFRSRKSGKFVGKKKCGHYRRQRVRATKLGTLFHL